MARATGIHGHAQLAPGGAGQRALQISLVEFHCVEAPTSDAPPALTLFFDRYRWFAPPANFRQPSGLQRESNADSQIPFIELHSAAPKQLQVFLPEGPCPMMLLLFLNVSADILNL